SRVEGVERHRPQVAAAIDVDGRSAPADEQEARVEQLLGVGATGSEEEQLVEVAALRRRPAHGERCAVERETGRQLPVRRDGGVRTVATDHSETLRVGRAACPVRQLLRLGEGGHFYWEAIGRR